MLMFQPTIFKVSLLFLLDVRCSKGPHSFCCGCLSPMVVHLRTLGFFSTPFAQMWLTQKDVKRRRLI